MSISPGSLTEKNHGRGPVPSQNQWVILCCLHFKHHIDGAKHTERKTEPLNYFMIIGLSEWNLLEAQV